MQKSHAKLIHLTENKCEGTLSLATTLFSTMYRIVYRVKIFPIFNNGTQNCLVRHSPPKKYPLRKYPFQRYISSSEVYFLLRGVHPPKNCPPQKYLSSSEKFRCGQRPPQTHLVRKILLWKMSSTEILSLPISSLEV